MTATYRKKPKEATNTATLIICAECGGTGAKEMPGQCLSRCYACNGTGYKPSDANSADAPHSAASSSETENSAKPIAHFSPSDAVRALSILNTIFLDDGACRTWTISSMHLERCCPWCDAVIEDEATINNFELGRKCTCKRCSRCFTARTKTFLEGSQLSYSQVFLMAALIDLMQNGITPASIAEIVGVSVDTVRGWQKRFRVFDDK